MNTSHADLLPSGGLCNPTYEEFPMTMQVGMVASDGVLLASDKQWVESSAFNHSFLSVKMGMNAAGTVAVACARSMELSVEIGQRILHELTPGDWESPQLRIEEIAREVLRGAEDPARRDAQCLIVSRLPSPRLYRLWTGRVNGAHGMPHCRQVENKAVTGDTMNAGVYWLERCYRSDRTMAELAPLAAQVIVSSAILNPAGIGGMHMLFCGPEAIEQMSDEQARALEAAALARDGKVAAMLGGKAGGPYQRDFPTAARGRKTRPRPA